MVVQKVSVNRPLSLGFGAVAPQNQQSAGVSAPSKPRKDYTKAMGWVAAGLAAAGLAGVLIYNARKGKAPGGSDSLTGVGTYLRKFLDESIFAKSAEAVKNGSKDVAVKISADGNDWQLCNYKEYFGCHLVKKIPEGQTDLPHVEFNSRALNIRIYSENADNARFDFKLGEDDDFMLSIDVEPWRGKIKKSAAAGANGSYNFTNEQCQNIMESLDMKRLVDEPSYRAMYTNSLYQMVGDVVNRTNFQKIAEKSGKTFDEIQNLYKSKEFNSLREVSDAFALVHHRYGLPDSETFTSIKGKDIFEMLEDFVSGKSKFNIVDDFVESDVHFAADKVCYDVSIPTQDGAGVLEHLRFSKDHEYMLYERFNPGDAADKLHIRYYYPDDTNFNCITDLETKGASFYIDSAFSGRNRVEVTNPKNPAETLKFDFNSNRQWNEDIEYGDELEPDMGYIEKLAKMLSNAEENVKFVHDFATKGKEMLEELAK